MCECVQVPESTPKKSPFALITQKFRWDMSTAATLTLTVRTHAYDGADMGNNSFAGQPAGAE